MAHGGRIIDRYKFLSDEGQFMDGVPYRRRQRSVPGGNARAPVVQADDVPSPDEELGADEEEELEAAMGPLDHALHDIYQNNAPPQNYAHLLGMYPALGGLGLPGLGLNVNVPL